MHHDRAILGGFLWPRAALMLLGALVLAGCASAVAVRLPPAGPDSACVTPAPDREVLIGVALSGGGRRLCQPEAAARDPGPDAGGGVDGRL